MVRSKVRAVYACTACGSISPKWQGKCDECGEWNTLVESVEAPRPAARMSAAASSRPQQLARVGAEALERLPVPLDEVGRVLGGGIVPGSLVLIGGEPGVGKSTLLLQLSELLARSLPSVLYVSAEESVEQIRLRAARMGAVPESLWVLAETRMTEIVAQIETLRPRLVIVDSIQTVYSEELESAAGSVTQVRDCTTALMRLAKSSGTPVFLVGHVTKEGAIAGPKVLEHMVDTVLYLEGERFQHLRLLRAAKNRFGSTNEVGVFEMTQDGLTEVPNPSEAFLSERPEDTVGSSVCVLVEGSRPLLVEVQALTSRAGSGVPRRTANGLDYNRLLMLLAVLTKRLGLKLSEEDVYVNVVGGLRLEEPSSDLAVSVAVASSATGRRVQPDTVLVGEVGLSGELRSVPHLERRLAEAARLGFKRAVTPRTRRRSSVPPGISLVQAATLQEAVARSLAAPEGS